MNVLSQVIRCFALNKNTPIGRTNIKPLEGCVSIITFNDFIRVNGTKVHGCIVILEAVRFLMQ